MKNLDTKKIFFIGINGIGMSGLARISKNMGYEVFGSDISQKEITNQMREIGINIFQKHNDLNIKGMDLVVYSSAIKKDNPEFLCAKINNIKMMKRGKFLAYLMEQKISFAVAGTHGKTTTSSMLGLSLLKLEPTIVVGGILPEIKSNAYYGSSDLFVAEADESDNSFLYMNPDYSIITNIEADHLENHGNYENIKNSFEKFIHKTKKMILINKDFENLYELSKKFSNKNKLIYSIEKEADIYSKNIEFKNGISIYEVIYKNKSLGEFKLSIPGKHNISNSLGVIAIALEIGVSLEEIKEKLFNFKGAKRRFDILYKNDIMIVDDYAHHPTEIKATLDAAKNIMKTEKIIAIFQPHRYTRTKFLMSEFKNAFKNADELIILPIYSAGESSIPGINSGILLENIEINGNKTLCEKEEDLINRVSKKYEKGDVYIFMGAGDVSSMAYKVKKSLEGI